MPVMNMSVMNMSEMRAFIKKTSKIEVRLKKVKKDKLEPYVGLSYHDEDSKPIIEVTEGLQKSINGCKVSKSFIRAFLLHELGHFHTKKCRAAYRNEYNAHVWAISKALDLGYSRVVSSLREEIISWQNLDNNRYYMKYRKASDLYLKEQGFII